MFIHTHYCLHSRSQRLRVVMPALISTNPRSACDAGFANTLPLESCTSPPVNRIPVEVLAEIFTHCHQNDLADRRIPPHFLITPLILGRVCSYWKDITLAFPILWSSILVHYPRRRHVPMVKLWLARSGNCPLSLTILHHPISSPQQHKVTDEILSWFIRHVSRWREIDFRLDEIVQRPLLTIPEGAAKSLESVALDLESCDQDSTNKIWRAIHASPSLRRVNWWRSYGYLGMPIDIPWAQLTHIMLHPLLTVDELLDILKLCRRVQVLKVYSLSAHSTPISRAPLVVPTLHTMLVCVRPHSGTLLDLLTLPSIHSLDVEHGGSFVPRNSESLHNLLVRSSCILEKLVLSDNDIAEEDLLRYLNSPRLVSLTELGVIGCLTDITVASLTHRLVDGSENSFLPNLRIISLEACFTSDGVVSAMIASRFTPDRLLKSVKVCLKGTSSVRDFALLRKMRGAGLFVDAYAPASGSEA